MLSCCASLTSSDSGPPAQFVGVSPRLWERSKAAQSPSWPYRMPQNFPQQGNGGYQPGKAYLNQGEEPF